jgi:hypothetical protein
MSINNFNENDFDKYLSNYFDEIQPENTEDEFDLDQIYANDIAGEFDTNPSKEDLTLSKSNIEKHNNIKNMNVIDMTNIDTFINKHIDEHIAKIKNIEPAQVSDIKQYIVNTLTEIITKNSNGISINYDNFLTIIYDLIYIYKYSNNK